MSVTPDMSSPDSGYEDAGPPVTSEVDAGRDLGAGTLMLRSPQDGARVRVGEPVVFAGRTGCREAVVSVVADGMYELDAVEASADGSFEIEYAFNTAGEGREMTVSAAGAGGCSAERTLRLDVVVDRALHVMSLTDAAGCAFEVASVSADPRRILVHGDDTTPQTVASWATTLKDAGHDVIATWNAGYFGFGAGPYSYAKGGAGYESRAAVVKGPRACLVIDTRTGTSSIQLSMGRDASGSLLPDATDVVCAGPRLVAGGEDVSEAAFVEENFETSGIGKDARLPRSGVCLKADGAVVLLSAQSPTTRACGFDLRGFASHMIEIGCVEGMNLDGGGSTGLWYEDGSSLVGVEDRPVYQVLTVLRP